MTLPTVLTLALVCLSPSGHAQLSESAQSRLVSALDAVCVAENLDAAHAAGEVLISPDVSQQEWSLWFANWARNHIFTLPLARFWEYIPAQAGSSQSALRLQAATCATAIVFAEPRRHPPLANDIAGPSSDLAARVLLALSPSLEEGNRESLLGVAALALENKPLDVQAEVTATPDRVRVILQAAVTAMTLAQVSETSQKLYAVLKVNENALSTLRNAGVGVLDAEVFDEPHHKRLESILLSFPATAHGAAAIVVASDPGLRASCAGLASSGPVLLINSAPLTNEADPKAPSPFVLDTVRELARSAWNVQAASRPALLIRRDILLSRMAAQPGSEVWPEATSGQWLMNPDEFAPTMAAAWFFNAPAMLQRAVESYMAGRREPVQSLLLWLDVLSGGKDTIPIPAVDSMGMVTNKPLAIIRTRREELTMPPPPDPGMIYDIAPYGLDAFVSGWNMEGTPQTFDLQEFEFILRPVGPAGL